jgi:type VII secretion protein EccB
MQTQRDQVQAYQFSTSRLVAAVTTGDPGNGQSPFRRAGLGVVAGTVIAVLLGAGAVVWGLLHPVTKTTWQQPGAVVVNSSTGTRFVYLGGELHPVANYASALLASGGDSSVQVVAPAALDGVRDGATIGIPGAPETLPAAGGLLAGGWAACLDPASPGATVLDLAPPAHLAPPPSGERILVTAPNGAQYVVWDGTKYPLRSKAVLVALGLGNTNPVTASATWLDALPTGPALAPAAVPGAGGPGPKIGGQPTTVGELFETTAGGVQQYYELRDDGLAPISGTELALLTTTAGAYSPVKVSPADIAAAPVSADKSLLDGLPDLTSGPVYAPGDPALCVRQTNGQSGSATGTLVTESAARVSAAAITDGAGVLVPQGDGMIAGPPSGAAEAATAPTYLITDTGEKYLLSGPAAESDLGYGSATPQVLPAGLLNLVPSGPALSAVASRQAVTSWEASR